MRGRNEVSYRLASISPKNILEILYKEFPYKDDDTVGFLEDAAEYRELTAKYIIL